MIKSVEEDNSRPVARGLQWRLVVQYFYEKAVTVALYEFLTGLAGKRPNYQHHLKQAQTLGYPYLTEFQNHLAEIV